MLVKMACIIESGIKCNEHAVAAPSGIKCNEHAIQVFIIIIISLHLDIIPVLP